MIKEYVILGGVLIVMGAVQFWLRWGPWAKEYAEAERKSAERRAQREDTEDSDDAGGTSEASTRAADKAPVVTQRGAKIWTKWTAILGPLSIAFGLMLVIWGAIGR